MYMYFLIVLQSEKGSTCIDFFLTFFVLVMIWCPRKVVKVVPVAYPPLPFSIPALAQVLYM